MSAALRVLTATGFLRPIDVDFELPADVNHYDITCSAIDPSTGMVVTKSVPTVAFASDVIPDNAVAPPRRVPCALRVLQQTMQATAPSAIMSTVAALGWQSLGFVPMQMDDSVSFMQRLLDLASKEAALFGVALPWSTHQVLQQGGHLCTLSGELRHPDPVCSVVTELAVPPADSFAYTIQELCHLHFAGEHVQVLHCPTSRDPHMHIHEWQCHPLGPMVAYRLPRFM